MRGAAGAGPCHARVAAASGRILRRQQVAGPDARLGRQKAPLRRSEGRRAQRGAAETGGAKAATRGAGQRGWGSRAPPQARPGRGCSASRCPTLDGPPGAGPSSAREAVVATAREGLRLLVAPQEGEQAGAGPQRARLCQPRPLAEDGGRVRARRLGLRPPVTVGLAGGDVARRSELTY